MNPRSLRFRLVMWYAGFLTAVFLLFGVAIYQVLRGYLENSLAETLLRRSDQIAGTLLTGIDKTGESYVAREIDTRYAPEKYDRFVRVTKPDGSVLYRSGPTASFDPTGLRPLETFAGIRDRTEKVTLQDGSSLLLTTKVFNSAAGQKYVIESGGPMAPIETILHHLLFLLLIGVPLVGLVAVGGGYYLVGRALAPVVRIAQSAEQISLHNLSERLPLTNTGDELEHLSLALNRMIERLGAALEHNRRFLADASHELRTPLAALRGELEGVVEHAGSLPELSDKAGSALEEVDRLTKIVDALFAISRLDAGEVAPAWERFDLAPLVASTTEQMSLLAEDKGIAVDCNVQGKVSVDGDPARIKQVVVNLVDNAIKYTPSGGAIHLDVHAREGKAVIEVADDGIGIPESALPHIFERFFRVDEARSRDLGGAGLGLAIVKSICAAHGGKISVDSVEGKGSRFEVELPLAAAGHSKPSV